MSEALEDRLAGLLSELGPRAAAHGLALRGPELPAALALPPAAAAWAEAALRSLAGAALLRAQETGRGGVLELGLGVVLAAGDGRLRALAADALPGLSEGAQAAAFAFLAGAGPPPAPDSLRLAALKGTAGLAELDFASAVGGNWLWTELALPPAGGAALPPAADAALPGWSRRSRLDAQDLLRRLGGNPQIAHLVIATFRADAPLQLAALAAALPTRPAEALRLAHSLKGAARNVGALLLGEVAAAAEAALQAGRLERAGACLPRLHWELAQLESHWAAGTA